MNLESIIIRLTLSDMIREKNRLILLIRENIFINIGLYTNGCW